MKELDYEKWKRKDAYEFFSGISNPFYMVTFRQDVTNLYDYTNPRGLSFYYGMVWACTQAINQTDAFLKTMKDGKLMQYERRDPSFTDLHPEAEQFHIVTMDHIESIDDFCRAAARQSRAQNSFIDLSKESDALIYFSCLPWVDLTALTNERDLNSPGALDDSIPRITWGRYSLQNGGRTLGISLEVNHRFIDGFHIGLFAMRLGNIIEDLDP